MQCDSCGQCEECGTRLFQAGERIPPGSYLRVDDGSFQPLLISGDVAPATFDGHVALYRAAAATCACERRQSDAPDITDGVVASGSSSSAQRA